MKVFIEEQRFTQVWLHLILAISFGVSFVLIIKNLMHSGWDDTDAKVGFFMLIGSLLLTYGLILSLKLKTRIDEKGVSYRFIPFHFSVKLIPWNEIQKIYIRKYDAISEYGGWGIKGGMFWRKSKGVAYNVKGDLGLQLELKNGKKILIGTQKENEINSVLRTYYKNDHDEI